MSINTNSRFPPFLLYFFVQNLGLLLHGDVPVMLSFILSLMQTAENEG